MISSSEADPRESASSAPAITPPPDGVPVVCMFVRNLFHHDARVTREALTLVDQGFHVVVFAIAAKDEETGEDWAGPLQIFRVLLDTPVLGFARLLLEFSRRWYRIASFPRRTRIARIGRKIRRVGSITVRREMFVMRLPPERARAEISARHFARGATLTRAYHALAPLAYRALSPLLASRRFPADAELVLPPPVRKRRPPLTVPTVNRMRYRIRDFTWPAHRFLQTLKFGRLAGEMAASLNPVAYHCHDLNSIMAGVFGRRVHAAPVIYDSHELWPHRNRPDARRRKTFVIERADRFWSRRVDAVITVNESIARHMERRYGVARVNIVRNVPALSVRVTPEPEWTIDHIARPRLLYVGGIRTNRGLEELIDAVAMVREGTLVAIGPSTDKYRAALEERAARAGVADRVVFRDTVPHAQLIGVIGMGDVGFSLGQNACLSYYLSLPNKFSEYLHAGLPIVSSDFPEMRRLVELYDVGVVCDSADPSAIARAVNDLLSRPDDLVRMRENTKRAAVEMNWELEQERLLDIYRALVPAERWPKSR